MLLTKSGRGFSSKRSVENVWKTWTSKPARDRAAICTARSTRTLTTSSSTEIGPGSKQALPAGGSVCVFSDSGGKARSLAADGEGITDDAGRLCIGSGTPLRCLLLALDRRLAPRSPGVASAWLGLA